jgi:MscS family membrane protein
MDSITQHFPHWLVAAYAGMALWVWLAIPVFMLLAFALAWFVGLLTRFIVKRSEDRYALLVGSVKAVAGPVDLLLGVWFFRLAREALPLTDGTKAFLGFCEVAVSTFAATWLLLRITKIGADRLAGYFDNNGRSHAKAVIPLLRKVAKSAIVLVGVMFLLQNLKVDVGAMIAGLGIGGLALALAGKNTVENLFAGVSLVMDQPARVGDTCDYGGKKGTIEDIGLRSTRIRTEARTIVTIPNSKLAEMQIENFASRDRILLKTVLSLRSETTPDQLRGVLKAIKELLDGRNDIAKGARVRFSAITQNSLDLELTAYAGTRDYNEFMRVREEVFLQIMDAIAANGTAFAAPSPAVIVQTGQPEVSGIPGTPEDG